MNALHDTLQGTYSVPGLDKVEGGLDAELEVAQQWARALASVEDTRTLLDYHPGREQDLLRKELAALGRHFDVGLLRRLADDHPVRLAANPHLSRGEARWVLTHVARHTLIVKSPGTRPLHHALRVLAFRGDLPLDEPSLDRLYEAAYRAKEQGSVERRDFERLSGDIDAVEAIRLEGGSVADASEALVERWRGEIHATEAPSTPPRDHLVRELASHPATDGPRLVELWRRLPALNVPREVLSRVRGEDGPPEPDLLEQHHVRDLLFDFARTTRKAHYWRWAEPLLTHPDPDDFQDVWDLFRERGTSSSALDTLVADGGIPPDALAWLPETEILRLLNHEEADVRQAAIYAGAHLGRVPSQQDASTRRSR